MIRGLGGQATPCRLRLIRAIQFLFDTKTHLRIFFGKIYSCIKKAMLSEPGFQVKIKSTNEI